MRQKYNSVIVLVSRFMKEEAVLCVGMKYNRNFKEEIPDKPVLCAVIPDGKSKFTYETYSSDRVIPIGVIPQGEFGFICGTAEIRRRCEA